MKPSRNGITIRRIPAGFPGEGACVLRLHYTCDPSMTPERIAELKKKFASPARWEREMEIVAEALSGARLFPEYIPEQNDCDPFDISNPRDWTIWHGCDPHMRTPHAFSWLAFNREGDFVVCGELWTKDRYWGCREWAEVIKWIESDSTDKPADWDWARGKSLKVFKRVMDTHGAAANSEEGGDFFDVYRGHGLAYEPARKSQQILMAARDAISDLLRPHPAYDANGKMFMFPRGRIFRSCKEARFEFLNARYPEGEVEKPSQEKPKTYRKHVLDCITYCFANGARYVEPMDARRREFVPIYESTAY